MRSHLPIQAFVGRSGGALFCCVAACKTNKHTTTIGSEATNHDKNRPKSNDTRPYWIIKLYDCSLNRYLQDTSLLEGYWTSPHNVVQHGLSQFGRRLPYQSESRGPLSTPRSDVPFSCPSGMMSIGTVLVSDVVTSETAGSISIA